jgi:hypothetical protein
MGCRRLGDSMWAVQKADNSLINVERSRELRTRRHNQDAASLWPSRLGWRATTANTFAAVSRDHEELEPHQRGHRMRRMTVRQAGDDTGCGGYARRAG